ncbi:MAG: transglycosylase SLT domain-containing protein [Oscillospiraceae bacterium]|nr:transglycosylase SLT domain-containing protein [Oscillospiraceae bacterium]
MSQRSEKYARSMERRVGALEERMDKTETNATQTGTRLGILEDDLAVYKAAMACKQARQNREAVAERVQAHRLQREEKQNRQRVTHCLGFIFLGVLVAILVSIIAARTAAVEPVTETPTTAQTPAATATVTIQPATLLEAQNAAGEDPLEDQKIEEALLASGYLSIAVPLDYTLQDIMRTACAEYGCPYPLALAVAEVESNFNMDTIGTAGEVGIMQLNPGPGGSYHAELSAATGRDPATPEGNIYCGVYLLGKYMATYQDAAKAAMAYNMGVGGAKKAWAVGTYSTDYTAAVLEAMENWECTVNAWNGV